ncbi:MAG: response regulator [Pyrinomonadaceae bacterium MAG19_C2-C3]|nr:response regulator [Pyrinomonadaceae bacterium MAG19_C2-C3]
MNQILVIEDQEDLATLYEKELSGAGYKVVNAYSGEEGIAEFEAGGADAILLDVTLPEMNGIQTLEEIRRRDASVPVIIVTGETHDDFRAQCERLGVTDYLTKPPNFAQLLNTVTHALNPNTDKDFEVVTVRLLLSVVDCLRETDANLERAITQWCEERSALKDATHATQTAANRQEANTKLNGEIRSETSNDEALPARPSFFQSIKQRLRNRR